MAENYEMAAAYVAIIPTLAGIKEALEKEVQKASPDMKNKISGALSSAGASASQSLSKSINGALAGIGRGFGKALSSSVVGVGSALKSAVTTAASAAGGALAASVTAVGTQALAGGFSRAMGINDAQAKLSALGYSAAEVSGVMKTVGTAIDGTSYNLGEGVGTAASLLSAGISQGKELEGILKSTSKIADISGRSFADMGNIMAKNAASGVVQWEDMNQLIEAQIPIHTVLSKRMGKSVAEIKKMASAGEITFDAFAQAINSIDFDSAEYASKSVNLAFKNVKAQISRIGAALWTPIIEGLAPVLNKVREGLQKLQNNEAFMKWVNNIQIKLASFMKFLSGLADIFLKQIDKLGKSGDNTSVFHILGEKIERFKQVIKGAEGPLIGLGLALSSQLLSKLPLIGGLFGGLTIAGGLMGGALVGAYNDSQALRDSFTRLKDSIKGLLNGFSGGNFEGILGKVGDSIAKVVESISSALSKISLNGSTGIDFTGIIDGIATEIASFIDTLSQRGGEIAGAVSGVIGSIKDALGDAFGGSELDIGKTIADTLVEVISFIGKGIELIMPALAIVSKAIVDIVSSDAMASVIDWVVNLAKKILEHEEIIKWLGVTIVALFLGKKLLGPIITFFSSFGKVGKVGAAAGKGIGYALAGLIQGIGIAMKALIQASPYIIGGIAVAGLVMIAIGVIGKVMQALDTTGGMGSFADAILVIVKTVVEAFKMLFDGVKPVLDWLAGVFIETLKVITGYLLGIITEVIKGVTSIIETFMTTFASSIVALAGLATVLFAGIDMIIKTLAENGLAAAAGAYALAGGVAALMAAFGIGSVGAGLGSAIGSLLGGEDMLKEMQSFLALLVGASAVVSAMPIEWSKVSVQAFAFGASIPKNIATGMTSGAFAMVAALSSSINSMLDNAQAQLDSRPLIVKTQLDSSGINSGMAFANGGNSTNNNTNYNFNSSNDSFMKSIIRSAR